MHARILAKHHLLKALANLRAKAIGSNATHVLCKTDCGQFLVSSRDLSIGRYLAYRGAFAGDQLAVILQRVNPDSRCLFVGAHVGTLVIPVSKKVHSVVAIEGDPANFETLKMNLLLNDCANVTPIHSAVSDHRGTVRFVKSDLNTGAGHIKQGSFPVVKGDNTVEEIACAPVDDLLNGFRPSYIVMDIEGHEFAALSGMQRALSSAECLMTEFSPVHIEEFGGVTCEQLLGKIPERFSKASIVPENRTVSRSALLAEMPRLRSKYYTASLDIVFAR